MTDPLKVLLLGRRDIGNRIAHYLIDKQPDVLCYFLTGEAWDSMSTREADPWAVMLDVFKPDIGVSVLWHKRIPAHVLSAVPRGFVNLHPSYLPYNRGEMPATWSIIEGTPAGVTLHWMSEELDAGPIIERVEVPKRPTDTAWTLYNRCLEVGESVFYHQWPRIKNGTAGSYPQPPLPAGVSPYHRRDSVQAVDRIPVEHSASMLYLLNLLRARTWSEHGGAYFMADGKKVYVRVQLEEAKDE
ncbi:MAG: formyltransferase family protein [Dehalococcoidia bacterium]|nr:formyltransferase family protein [Dehalococcoidia bacterium]